MRQLLIDDTLELSEPGLITDETVERMTTLYPCGHSFPYNNVSAVTAHLEVIDELLERHTDATNAFEIQSLREAILSTSAKLDMAADRCVAQMDTTHLYESTGNHNRGSTNNVTNDIV